MLDDQRLFGEEKLPPTYGPGCKGTRTGAKGAACACGKLERWFTRLHFRGWMARFLSLHSRNVVSNRG